MTRPRMLAALLTTFLLAQAAQAEECPITKAMGDLPSLTYKVGSTETCCVASANALAAKNDATITYVVGKKEFENEAAATMALTEATETFVTSFAKPKTCEVSGKTTVAGREMCCPATAAQTAKIVTAAMEKVEMTYLVGQESCNCAVRAETLAQESGNKKQFVVNGEKLTCSVKARLALARAKYKAAVEALVAAQSKTADATS